MNKELIKIRDLFFAGKSAFEKDRLIKTLKKVNTFIEKIILDDLLKKQKNLIPLLTDIFSSAYPGKLAGNLATELNKNTFFNFGNYLLQ